MSLLLGEKGANLAEMCKIRLPVPPGFIITTEACNEFLKTGELPEGCGNQIADYIFRLEEESGKKFDDNLAVSVRYGARVSMPGVMESVLNVGFNDKTVENFASRGGEFFAYDSYARLIRTFGIVILGIRPDRFPNTENKKKACQDYKKAIEEEGFLFPQDPKEQVVQCIKGIFRSWNHPKAIDYRKNNDITDKMGTACVVQTMVYGNLKDSGTGVCFSRDPSTGKKRIYGEFISGTQGEDLVSGLVTPRPVEEMSGQFASPYAELKTIATLLENHYRDMQYLEFTVEERILYVLETTSGKRTIQAAVRIAVEMEQEGIIDRKEAIMRINPYDVERMWHRRIDPNVKRTVIAKGVRASPGAAAGEIVFDPEKAIELSRKGKKVILVRKDTSPEDIAGILASEGILTSSGGTTSHASVIARGMGKPCITGADIKIDYKNGIMTAGGATLREGDRITIYGSTGEVMPGEVPTIEPQASEQFRLMLIWCDDISKVKVLVNADTPEDAIKGVGLGAQGIGLCRTEHMFFGDRLPFMQRMILAETEQARNEELKRMIEFQRKDFIEIFRIMGRMPVTIRLLDPPLHEFLPDAEELIQEITKMECSRITEGLAQKQGLLAKIKLLREKNPMLGLRGSRLGILYPEIFDMQVTAIAEAAVETGASVEIMVPLVNSWQEMKFLRERIESTIKKALKGGNINHSVGTMIELPRACIVAGRIAEYADFFSFGTNDLTQTTLGISRDDGENSFFKAYFENHIIEENPFAVLDENGVGELMKMAVRQVSRKKLSMCGEHGGDPKSIEFAHRIGLDYVSCSPYRIPVARLAAAQARIKQGLDSIYGTKI